MPTLAEWAQQYLDIYSANKHGVAMNSQQAGIVKRLVIEHSIGKLPLDQVREHHIENWYQELARGGVTVNTFKGYRSPLNTMMQWAVDRRLITVNPVRGAVKPNPKMFKPKRDIRVVLPAEVPMFLDACADDDRWGPLMATSLMLGCRPGEALALAPEDFGTDQHGEPICTIRHAIKRDASGRPIEVGPTKTGDVRTVEVNDIVLHQLKRQAEFNATHADTMVDDPRWSGLIFHQAGVMPWRSAPGDALERICAAAKIAPALTPYALRHSCASLMLDQTDLSERQIAEWMGHSVDVLREHYAHKIDPVTRGGRSMWDGLVGGAG